METIAHRALTSKCLRPTPGADSPAIALRLLLQFPRFVLRRSVIYWTVTPPTPGEHRARRVAGRRREWPTGRLRVRARRVANFGATTLRTAARLDQHQTGRSPQPRAATVIYGDAAQDP